MILICHVILQDHMIKGSSNLIDRSPLWQVTNHCGTGYMMVLIYHVISQDHAIKDSYDFLGRNSSM